MKSLRWNIVHFEELMAGQRELQMVLIIKLHIIKGLTKKIVHWQGRRMEGSALGLFSEEDSTLQKA